MATESSKLVGEEITLDTSKADRGIWLIKAPRAICEVWKSGEPNEKIGVVKMTFNPLKGTADPSTKFTMALTKQGSAVGLPLEFNLNRAQEIVPTLVFSETPQGKMAVEGKIDQKFDIQPKPGDPVYQQFIRNRDISANVPKKQIQVLEVGKRGAAMTPLPLFSNLKRDSAMQTTPPKPRIYMSKENLESLVFKLFEKEQFWGMKQLIAETKQSQLLLKHVLTEVCDYHKRGAHQGMYELKPEYRKAPKPDE